MQQRVKVSENERAVLTEYFDAVAGARMVLDATNRELTAACRMILGREGINKATVDGLVGDELVLTIPDAPEELQDADRRPETPRVETPTPEGTKDV